MKRIILITGASSGFGREFAYQLDERFGCIDEFWLVARNKEALNELSGELNTKSKVIPLDLSKEEAIDELLKNIKKERAIVKMLINSAGFGKLGEVNFQADNDCSDMIKLNCLTLTMLSKRLLPYMDYNSRIINIASVAAFLPQPEFAVYAATKSYVLSFTRALNAEIEKYDVYATAVCPGPANTNFFNVAEEHASTPWYKQMFMAEADKVVELAIKDSICKKEVSVYSIPMKIMRVASKLIPHKLIINFMK